MATDLLKLLNNLRQMIKQQTDLNQLTGVKHKLKRLVGLIEVTLKKHGDPDKREFMKSIKEVISKAEEFVETYGKKVSESETAGIYKKPVHWVQLFCMRKRLKEIKHDIKDVRKKFLLPDGTHDLKHASDDSLAEKAGFWDQYYWMQCMYHLLIFPADVEVPKRRLIALWVAEGLIGPKDNQSESDEQVAERYLHELIKLEKVLVAKKKRNGKVQACKLNREMCLPGPVEDDSTADEHDSRAEEGDLLRKRRLVDHSGIDSKEDGRIKIHGNPNISQSVPKHGNFVSFLSFDTNQEDNPGEDIGNFLQSCIWAGCFSRLKVLDLEGVFRPKLPRTLGKLIHLKYLGLRWTYLEELPDFVNKLLNLQVLDVKHTYFSFLPSSIWSMQYLRHLYLSEVNGTRFPERPSTNVSLTALQTLWGAFIDENTCVTGGLDTLENIRKLGLSCSPSRSGSSMLKQLKAVDKWISNLKFLESLRLKSRDKDGKASDLCLSSLKGNISLSTVYLFGKLSPCVVCELPKSITDVTLSVSELDLDPMQFLGKLPKLVILRLLGQSVVHNRMHCSRGSFPQLKILHIWKLENLEEWEVDDGSLPCLEELDIRSCNKLYKMHCSSGDFPELKLLCISKLENLKEWEIEEGSLCSLEVLELRSCQKLKMLPDGLQRVTKLKKLRLTNMPQTFIDQTKARQPQTWDKIEVATEVGKNNPN